VAESIITNYDLPQSRLALGIRVSVDYDSDPDRVEAVLVDEATRAAPDVPGLLDDPRPIARLIPGFGESSLDFTLVCQVASLCPSRPGPSSFAGRVAAQVMRGRSRTVASTASATSMRPANPIQGPR